MNKGILKQVKKIDIIVDQLSPFPGVWSFLTIQVCRDRIQALPPSCKKQLPGVFVRLFFFLKVKHINERACSVKVWCTKIVLISRILV